MLTGLPQNKSICNKLRGSTEACRPESPGADFSWAKSLSRRCSVTQSCPALRPLPFHSKIHNKNLNVHSGQISNSASLTPPQVKTTPISNLWAQGSQCSSRFLFKETLKSSFRTPQERITLARISEAGAQGEQSTGETRRQRGRSHEGEDGPETSVWQQKGSPRRRGPEPQPHSTTSHLSPQRIKAKPYRFLVIFKRNVYPKCMLT